MESEKTSNRATRAASAGLAGVVIALAAFSLFAAYTTRTHVDRAEHLASLHESYQDAITAIRGEETSQLEYLLEPSVERGAKLSAASQALINAVQQIEIRGGAEDVELAKNLRAQHDRFFVAAERVAGLMAAGNPSEARRVDEEEADPLFLAMQALLTTATEERAAEADAAFEALRSTSQWMLILAPIVFGIGFALLLGLWRVLERYHRGTRETYRRIEQLSRLRGEFIAIVSHEFRTPLTGIQGFSEMMRDDELTIPEMREYAGDINKDARRLSRLINDMLDLDQMESGLMTPKFALLDLNGIAARTAAPLNGGDHAITLDLDDRLPQIVGDADRLEQVVGNLLSNAIKYSPKGTPVEVRTRTEDGTVVLTVSDRGVGIPNDQLENIFQRYSQTESGTRSIQGTGLGLPIVRQIVRLHDGRVWATSEPGRGSVFHVQLPLARSTAMSPSRAQPQPRARSV